MKPIKALIISNGIEGLNSLYKSTAHIQYDVLEVTSGFDPDLTPYDLLIAPNGTDHLAMYRIRERVKDFLQQGKVLFCFDGWFTDWVPGNRWVMDNSKKSSEVRYRIKDDPYGMSEHFSAADLTFSHGISGWWSCGYIEAAPEATVLLEDTWGRSLLVIDQAGTNGIMVLSASGPLADVSYATTDDNRSYQAMTSLYQNILSFVQQKMPLSYES